MADSAGQDTSQTSTDLYKPLSSSKSIRLLKVFPDKDDEVIRCELIPVDLADSEHPGYIALSYEWRIHRGEIDFEEDGDTNEQVSIQCDRHEIKIGRNLWDFLVGFRKADALVESYLWVDAICINQSDDVERSQQVKLMGDVYSLAESVIAWLGKFEEEDKSLFNDKEIDFYDLQREILRRPYWCRVWIVQEVCLAQSLNVWYGPHRYNPSGWNLPVRILRMPYGVRVLEIRQLVHALGTGDHSGVLRLGELVSTFDEWQCTEPLDGVYGFIGIASYTSGSPPGIDVDYDREPVEVLIDVVKNHHTSHRKGHLRWSENALISRIMRRLDVSFEKMRGHLLESFPGLKAYQDLIIEENLPLIATRLFTTGFLDYDPGDFDDNGDPWFRLSEQDDNSFDEKLKACEYFRPPRTRSSSPSSA